MAAFVRPRYEYAINEDARRAQLAADVAAAELEKLRCRRDARTRGGGRRGPRRAAGRSCGCGSGRHSRRRWIR